MHTPLHLACRNGHLEVVKYLVSEVQCDPNCRTQGNATPLHLACQKGHLEVVKYLVCEVQSDPNHRTQQNETPLHFACLGGYFELVNYLLYSTAVKCEVIKNMTGHSPLGLVLNRNQMLSTSSCGVYPYYRYC